MKLSPLDRVLLLITCLLAAYMVVAGINGLEKIPTVAYTIAFGVLVVASLLIIILGFEVLNSRVVVIVSTIIPLALSLGLVWEHTTRYRLAYLSFVLIGFLAVVVTRAINFPPQVSVAVLTIVHGVAGLVVFLLPAALAARGVEPPGFALVSLGGALIGLGGLLLYFLRTGRPIVSREIILRILPALFMLTTLAFVIGFMLS
jgi:hypothetical protein